MRFAGLLLATACGTSFGAPLPEAATTSGASADATSSDAPGSADSSEVGGESTGGEEPGVEATLLPIEVIGFPGTTRYVDFELADEPTSPLELRLVLHNVLEPSAAHVRLNDGEPIDLGLIDGLAVADSGTGRGVVTWPVDALWVGANRLSFSYDRQIPAVSGFRILGLDVVVDGVAVGPELPLDGPEAWSSDASAEAIERGREFFTEVSRDGGPVCARCHAATGADLQYFAFSDHSIFERSRLHEFSEAESEDIVAYIRSLDVPRVGRPYDSPFQPGPENVEARGVGHDGVLDEAAFRAAAAWPDGDIPWDWPSNIDTFTLGAPVELPPWLRWLPRRFEDRWLTLPIDVGGAELTLGAALSDFEAEPSLASATDFFDTAVLLGKTLLVLEEDHDGRLQVMRFAAVKLWDWARRTGDGFAGPDHGLPDPDTGGFAAPFPYEVGFAFFEKGFVGEIDRNAMVQTIRWWWAQLAVHPGRGLSTLERPLAWPDVLLAAEEAGLGGDALMFLHLYGSWEVSRGSLAAGFGGATGAVALLEVPLRHLDATDAEALLARFLRRQAEFLDAGGLLTDEHHVALAAGWASACGVLSAAQAEDLRSLAHPSVLVDLEVCP